MIIRNYAPWNYYLIDGRRISAICLYDKTGFALNTRVGWFEDINNNVLSRIELPVTEIKNKRVQKFDGTVFLTGTKERSVLYIPIDMLNIKKTGYVLHFNSLYEIYKGGQTIVVSNYVKRIDNTLTALEEKHEELLTNLDSYELRNHTDKFIETLEDMKQLAIEYKEEKERVKALTVDDVLAQMKKDGDLDD